MRQTPSDRFTLLTVWLAVGLAAVTVSGCVSRPQPAPPPLATVYRAEIEQMIADGDGLAAIPRILALRDRPDRPVAVGTLDELLRAALHALRVARDLAQEEERYLDAVALEESLAVLAAEGPEGGGEREQAVADLYRREVQRLVAGGREVSGLTLALLVLGREVGTGTGAGAAGGPAGAGAAVAGTVADRLTADDFRALRDLAVRLGNRRALALIAQEVDARGLPLAVPAPPPPPPVAQMLEGTVTVEVDRGIDVQRGVGVPDRVIGSGFFIDRAGHLLSNYHVIQSEVDPTYDGYSRLFIKLSDRDDQKVPAKVVGYDRIFDLALLKAEVQPGHVFTAAGAATGTAGAREPATGDPVVAIGSPAGLARTVTSGIISATGRPFLQLGDALQVDAPLNPGNSGGPLLSQDGELIGVTYAGLEQFEGINFGISYGWIQHVLPRLYRGGEVSYLWLGASVHRAAGELVVNYVVPGSPAAVAGLAAGDVLLEIGRHPVERIVEVQRYLLGYHAPTLVPVRVRRAGEQRRLIVGLDRRPFLPLELALERDLRDNVLVPLFGFAVERVGGKLFGTDYRVTRVIPGSVADDTDIAVDDPVRIDRFEVDHEARIASVLISVKRRRGGFLASALLLAVHLEQEYFL